MVRAGADIVGIGGHHGPSDTLDALQLVIDGVKEAGLQAHFIAQPLAFHTPDAGKNPFKDLPEYPLALEPRVCTRWEVHHYARRAYEMGVRYIGGSCGFEPYHVRAISEELANERGKSCEVTQKYGLSGKGLKVYTQPWIQARTKRMYWDNLKPASGRPYSPALAKPDF